MQQIFNEKLDRLARGKKPRLLDLFSGCGGLTLGFHRAGCDIIGGVEIDPYAAHSHAINFHSDIAQDLFEQHLIPKDITLVNPHDLLMQYGYDHPISAVDILVGGPPCPAFTRVGRAKLREVREHPEAFRYDPRAKLYLPYLDYVKNLLPLAILMENVPDIMNFGGHNLAEEICDILQELGYNCTYTLLNSANYGVPQMRERFYLVGVHQSVEHEFKFPKPFRYIDFPQGYEGSRKVALKHVDQNNFFVKNHYVSTPLPLQCAEPSVTVQEAIRDLPIIMGHLDGTIKRGTRRFDTSVSYRSDIEPSSYAYEMRNWPCFESDGKIWDHVIRSLSDRDYRIFRNMASGDDYPKAHALAEKLFQTALENLQKSGSLIESDRTRFEALQKEYVPPYSPNKFPNKWRKMEPNKPARTLMAHLGKDTYSHIHYDSDQARVISVREAARLQSFPDGFRFVGSMNPAFRQIGNAVPPLMAFALATPLLQTLDAKTNKFPCLDLIDSKQNDLTEFIACLETV